MNASPLQVHYQLNSERSSVPSATSLPSSSSRFARWSANSWRENFRSSVLDVGEIGLRREVLELHPWALEGLLHDRRDDVVVGLIRPEDDACDQKVQCVDEYRRRGDPDRAEDRGLEPETVTERPGSSSLSGASTAATGLYWIEHQGVHMPTIVRDEEIRSGGPRIEGTRITVLDVKRRVIDEGEDPHVVAGEYGISMATLFTALAYYYDHREEFADCERELESERADGERRTRELIAGDINPPERAG